jgi:dTDP-4-dehydrorhamnose 3,5-epimerase-like enzyme
MDVEAATSLSYKGWIKALHHHGPTNHQSEIATIFFY